jgi:tRNA (guanine-N7-)-methyltransferase
MSLSNGEIPSYKVRRGRTGPTSRAALEHLLPRYVWDGTLRERPTVLEIGFGMGEATAQMAAAEPDVDLVAVDVHPAGLAALVRRLDEGGLDNVRVVEGDAVDVLTALPSGSLAGVRLFFPDPWPKKRHVKRRFLRPTIAALLADRLAPGAVLHVATDWQAYAEHAREVLSTWEVREVPRPPSRPVTGYERRAEQAGRVAVDLLCAPTAGARSARG